MAEKTVLTADEMQAKKAVPKKGAPKKTPKKKPASPTKLTQKTQARMEQMPEMARGQESPPEGTAQTGAVTGGASPVTPAMLSHLMMGEPPSLLSSLPQPGPGQVVSPEQQSYEEAMMEKRLAAQQRNRREARQNLKDEQMKFAEEEAVHQAVQDRQSNAARQQRLNYAQQVANEPSK